MPDETYTREEVLKYMRIAWDKSRKTEDCSCDYMHIFRIPWAECRENHENHMKLDIESLFEEGTP
jgi:hypothetical protein